MLNVLIQ